MKWRLITTKTIFEHPRLTLLEDRVMLPDGQQTTYLKHGPHRDYPTIIPINRDGKILMIREHAYPINQILLQFVEGDTEPDETLESAARRELQEEAGLRASKLTTIGYSLREHRRSTTRNFVLLAEDVSEITRGGGDVEEAGIEGIWLTESQIWNRIARGEIIQKNTLTAWTLYQASKKPTRSNQ